MVYLFIGIGTALLAIVIHFFLTRQLIAGRPVSRFSFCRICRKNGFSRGECRFLFSVFARCSTAAPAEGLASATMLLRILDLYIGEIQSGGGEAGLRDRQLARAFRIRHAVAAGLRSGRRGLANTFSLAPGTRCTLAAGEALFPAVLRERQPGYLVFDRPEGLENVKGRELAVTFWIPGESGYRFTAEVLDEAPAGAVLLLAHSSSLKAVQQRRFHRADCRLKATLEAVDGGVRGEGTIRDISAAGLLVETAVVPAVGELVVIAFALPGQGGCRPQARVLGLRGGRCRLQFTEVTLSDQNRILLHLHHPGGT